MNKIKIGIVGYGNVGKGAHKAVLASDDMEAFGIFTRRDPKTLDIIDKKTPVFPLDSAEGLRDNIDVMILCGGSATDLPKQGPMLAKNFNIVDSFDTHANIPEYLDQVNSVATATTAIISTGWDPGLFSMLRLLSEAVLPGGNCYTFWGKGVSQGHSDAIRRVDGVKNAVQYTIPIDSALDAVRRGECPEFTTRQKHLRQCYVVAQAGADGAKKSQIEETIKKLPNYFDQYDTTVEFISEEELKTNHSEMPHGGFVLHSGNTGGNADGSTGSNKQIIEYSLKLDSNPEFTGSVMAAYARAAYRLSREGQFGAKTVFDIPLTYISPKNRSELIRRLL